MWNTKSTVAITPGAELETSRDIQEMKSNGEVGRDLAFWKLQVSELPS